MKRQIRPRGARRGSHELATRALAVVTGAADASVTDPYPTLTDDALSYDPYRKFKFLVVWSSDQ